MAHVGDVHHLVDRVPEVLQPAPQEVREQEAAVVPDVRAPVDRRPAVVHANHPLLDRAEWGLLLRERVVDEEGQEIAKFSGAAGEPSAPYGRGGRAGGPRRGLDSSARARRRPKKVAPPRIDDPARIHSPARRDRPRGPPPVPPGPGTHESRLAREAGGGGRGAPRGRGRGGEDPPPGARPLIIIAPKFLIQRNS